MAAARPLREIFAELTGDEAARHADPAHLLRANGHPDLPDDLISEAVISFADTAPVEVAEHLAPYVAANSAVPTTEMDAATDIGPSSWVEALTTAPDAAALDGTDPTDGLDEAPEFMGAAAHPPADEPASYADADFGLGFGHGGGTADPLDTLDETSYTVPKVGDVSEVGGVSEVGDVAGAAVEDAPVADDTATDSVWSDDADDQPLDDGEAPELT